MENEPASSSTINGGRFGRLFSFYAHARARAGVGVRVQNNRPSRPRNVIDAAKECAVSPHNTVTREPIDRTNLTLM